MTDRELLELAAKAAGLKEGIGGAFWTEDGGVFDPLTDDGDALRLAVKLGLNIYIDRWVDCETNAWKDTDMTPVVDVTEKHHGDIYAATRRCITRAAAEIGRKME